MFVFELKNYDEDERDSGRWSDDYILPGKDLCDQEFTDLTLFSTTSESSNSSTPELVQPSIPTPPPLPPLQFWQPRFGSCSRHQENMPCTFLELLDLQEHTLIERRRRRTRSNARPIPNSVSKTEANVDVFIEVEMESEIPTTPPPTCTVCTSDVWPRSKRANPTCCNTDVCKECMVQMIALNINEGRPHIRCPNPLCSHVLTRQEIVKHISKDTTLLNKYERFRLNFEENGTKKTCPNCCRITDRDIRHIRKPTIDDLLVTCEDCLFKWCFHCHAPWHDGVNCSSYKKGDKQFKKWTRGRNVGFVPNCQRCPTCSVYIQRTKGCDMMTCNQCNEVFCYKCGGRFHSILGLGDHYKHTSVLGCSYNYKPEQPTLRRLVRGGYLSTKLIALTGYPVLFVGGCVVVLIGGAVALPIYGCYKLHNHLKTRRRMNRVQRRRRN